MAAVVKWPRRKRSSGVNATVQQFEVAAMVLRAGAEGITATEVAQRLNIDHSTAVLQLEHWHQTGKTSRIREGRRYFYYLSDSAIADIFQGWLQEQT